MLFGNLRNESKSNYAFSGLLQKAFTRLFGEMSQEDWEKLSQYIEEVDLPSGYYLFRQGDRGDAMYIIVSGRLQVQVEIGQQIKVVTELGRGEAVGEMAIITGENRSASIFSIRDCQLIRISKAGFHKFSNQFPAIGINLAKLLIQRLTHVQSSRRLRSISNVAIIPLHQSIDLQHTLQKIHQALSKSGKKVLLISSTLVDQELGEGAAQASLNEAFRNKKLTTWLDHQESQNDLAIYIPDKHRTEWTKRCIRQADEILLIADASVPPALTQIENILLSGESKLSVARQTLVLLQPPGKTMPSGTAQWLKNRNIGFIAHIRHEQNQRDFERLGRYLTDQLTGLVLAGGGAKGFAHIGVWKALQEANIPVDFIGGTSMGAMVGGLMAFDLDAEKVHAICREIAFSPLKRDFNLVPVISLFKGKILDRVLQKYYLHHDIEDCPIPYYCVSSNLTQAHPEVHQRGNMFVAIRASGAIPAVVPPVIFKKNLLIDGGVFNNFPTDVMIDIGAHFIIGVDFFVGQNQEINLNKIPSSWSAISSMWLGGEHAKNLPSLVRTIIQTTTLYSDYQQKHNIDKTDVYINPDVSKFGMLEWREYEKIVQKGYEKAVEVLNQSQDKIDTFRQVK